MGWGGDWPSGSAMLEAASATGGLVTSPSRGGPLTHTRNSFCDGRPGGWPPMHWPPARSSLAPVAASDRDNLPREVVELPVVHERPGNGSLVVRTAQMETRPWPSMLSRGTRRSIIPEMAKGLVNGGNEQHIQTHVLPRLDRKPASKDAGKQCPRPWPPVQLGRQGGCSREANLREATLDGRPCRNSA